MTIRVSHDSGQSFGEETTFDIDRTKPPVPLVTFVWPPCKCPIHRANNAQERRTA